MSRIIKIWGSIHTVVQAIKSIDRAIVDDIPDINDAGKILKIILHQTEIISQCFAEVEAFKHAHSDEYMVEFPASNIHDLMQALVRLCNTILSSRVVMRWAEAMALTSSFVLTAFRQLGVVQQTFLLALQRSHPQLSIISQGFKELRRLQRPPPKGYRREYYGRMDIKLYYIRNGAYRVQNLHSSVPLFILSRIPKVLAHLCQIGWKHGLWPRTTNRGFCNCADEVLAVAMRRDSVRAFQRCLEVFDLTPWDYAGLGNMTTFLCTATIHGAFAICNYLLDLGVEDKLGLWFSPSIMAASFRSHYSVAESKAKIHHLGKFVQLENHVANEFNRLVACLQVQISGETFNELRRLVWPDTEFYQESFSPVRHRLFSVLDLIRNIHPDVIRYIIMTPAPDATITGPYSDIMKDLKPSRVMIGQVASHATTSIIRTKQPDRRLTPRWRGLITDTIRAARVSVRYSSEDESTIVADEGSLGEEDVSQGDEGPSQSEHEASPHEQEVSQSEEQVSSGEERVSSTQEDAYQSEEEVSSSDGQSTTDPEALLTVSLWRVLYACYHPFLWRDDMPSCLDNDRTATYLGTRLARTQVALRTWLEAIRAAGIDLEEYAREEICFCRPGFSGDDESCEILPPLGKYKARIWNDGDTGVGQGHDDLGSEDDGDDDGDYGHDDGVDGGEDDEGDDEEDKDRDYTSCGYEMFCREVLQPDEVEIRMVGVQSGPRPQDRKILWNEPTDELAGKFWEEFEGQLRDLT